MPLELIKEGKESDEGLVRYGYRGVVTLQFMHVEEAAVEVGDFAEEFVQFGGMSALAQPIVKELQQEITIKTIESILFSHKM